MSSTPSPGPKTPTSVVMTGLLSGGAVRILLNNKGEGMTEKVGTKNSPLSHSKGPRHMAGTEASTHRKDANHGLSLPASPTKKDRSDTHALIMLTPKRLSTKTSIAASTPPSASRRLPQQRILVSSSSSDGMNRTSAVGVGSLAVGTVNAVVFVPPSTPTRGSISNGATKGDCSGGSVTTNVAVNVAISADIKSVTTIHPSIHHNLMSSNIHDNKENLPPKVSNPNTPTRPLHMKNQHHISSGGSSNSSSSSSSSSNSNLLTLSTAKSSSSSSSSSLSSAAGNPTTPLRRGGLASSSSSSSSAGSHARAAGPISSSSSSSSTSVSKIHRSIGSHTSATTTTMASRPATAPASTSSSSTGHGGAGVGGLGRGLNKAAHGQGLAATKTTTSKAPLSAKTVALSTTSSAPSGTGPVAGAGGKGKPVVVAASASRKNAPTASTTTTSTGQLVARANRQHHLAAAGPMPRSSHRPVTSSTTAASSQQQTNKKKDKEKVARLPVATSTPSRPLTKTATTTSSASKTEKTARLISGPITVIANSDGHGDGPDVAGHIDPVVLDDVNLRVTSRIDGDGDDIGGVNNYDGSSSFAYEGSNGSCYVSMSMTFNTTQDVLLLPPETSTASGHCQGVAEEEGEREEAEEYGEYEEGEEDESGDVDVVIDIDDDGGRYVDDSSLLALELSHLRDSQVSQGPLSVGESLASTKLVSIVQHLRHTLGNTHDNDDADNDDDDDDVMAVPSPSFSMRQEGARAMGHVDTTVWARVTRSRGKGPQPHPHHTITATTGIDDGQDHRPDIPDDQADDSDVLPLPSPITVPYLSTKSPVTVPQFTSMRPSTVAPLVAANATTAGGRGHQGLQVDTSSSSPRALSPGPSTSPVSFALTVTPRPLASAFSPVLPTQGQGLGQATTSFGFDSIDNHHHRHHDDRHDPLASVDISVIHATSSSSVAASNHLFLSLGAGFAATTNDSVDNNRVGVSGDRASGNTPFTSTDPSPLNRAYCDIEVSDSVRLYAARTHRHTHPLNTAVSASPPPSPPSLSEPQFSYSHTNIPTTTAQPTHLDTTASLIVNESPSCLVIDDTSTTDPDPSSLGLDLVAGPCVCAEAMASIDMDDPSSSLCMTSVGTLDRAMLQLDDDDDDDNKNDVEADETADDEHDVGYGGAGDIINVNDVDVDTDRLFVLPASLLDHSSSTMIDTSVGTLDRAMLQLTTTCTTVDIDVDNSQLSTALPSSLLIASFEQPSSSSSSSPLPLPLPSPNTTSNDTNDHCPGIVNENLRLHNSTATSDHSGSSGNSSSGLFSYESVSCHHEELRQLPSIHLSNMDGNSTVVDSPTTDLRRCAADPVAKTLLRLSGKFNDSEDHEYHPVGGGNISDIVDDDGGAGSGDLDGCVRGRDDYHGCHGEEGEEDDMGEGMLVDVSCEEEDVVRFCCSADAADDDREEDDKNDDDLCSPVSTPASFLFQPIDAAMDVTIANEEDKKICIEDKDK